MAVGPGAVVLAAGELAVGLRTVGWVAVRAGGVGLFVVDVAGTRDRGAGLSRSTCPG